MKRNYKARSTTVGKLRAAELQEIRKHEKLKLIKSLIILNKSKGFGHIDFATE